MRTRIPPQAVSALLSMALAAVMPAPPVSPAPQPPKPYVFTNLEALGGLAGSTDANDVNDAGHVVGLQRDPAGSTHAIYWDPGSNLTLDLGNSGGGFDLADSINNLDEVVGLGRLIPGDALSQRAFLWDPQDGRRDQNDLDGDAVPDHAGWVLRTAVEITDGRQVLGQGWHTVDGAQVLRAFRLDLTAGQIHDLGPGGAAERTFPHCMNNRALAGAPAPQIGIAVLDGGGNWLLTNGAWQPLGNLIPGAINDRGEVAGGDGSVAHYWDGVGPLPGQSLGTLGGGMSAALGINNASPAMVVGRADTRNLSSTGEHAFRWTVGSGGIQDLNGLASGLPKDRALRWAVAVSDAGHIVGVTTPTRSGTGSSNDAFLLTPVP